VLDYGEVAALPGDPNRLLAWINTKVDAHEAVIAPWEARLERHHTKGFLLASGLLRTRLDLTMRLMESLVSDYPLPSRVRAGLSAFIDMKTGRPVQLTALLETAVVDKPWQQPSRE
jgi:hypothetical protein